MNLAPATILVIALAAAPAVNGQTSRGVVSGRVLDSQGNPVPGTAVHIQERVSLGAVSDSGGRFVIREVPPGDHMILARNIGYDVDAAFVHIEGADSLELLLVIEPTHYPFPGSGLPVPGFAELRMATALLRQLLQDTIVTSFIRERAPESLRQDTLIVWVRWMTDADTLVIGEEPALRLTRDCETCATGFSRTIEGGALYTAGTGHVTVAVEVGRVGTPRVRFHVGFAPEGETLMLHARKPFSVTYVRRSEGDWINLKLN